MVETFEGCLMGIDPVSSIIYHEYWNKIRIEASNKGNDYERELAMKKKLETDSIMEKLDSIIIYTNKEVYWLLYNRTFENRKHKDSYLPRIEELAFKKNNSFAFEYLKKYYPREYSNQMVKYLTVDFPQAKFQTENDIYYLHSFIELLLETKNPNYKKIVVDKLKNDTFWKEESGWFSTTLKKHGIKI